MDNVINMPDIGITRKEIAEMSEKLNIAINQDHTIIYAYHEQKRNTVVSNGKIDIQWRQMLKNVKTNE